MNGLFLSAEELKDLTDLQQAHAQLRWLTNRGWKFEIGANGRPKVARQYYLQRMVQEATTPPDAPRKGPNLAALEALHRR